MSRRSTVKSPAWAENQEIDFKEEFEENLTANLELA